MAIAMVEIAFQDPSTKQVVAVTVPANIASGRVLEKAGFKQMENIIRGEEELAYFKLERK